MTAAESPTADGRPGADDRGGAGQGASAWAARLADPRAALPLVGLLALAVRVAYALLLDDPLEGRLIGDCAVSDRDARAILAGESPTGVRGGP